LVYLELLDGLMGVRVDLLEDRPVVFRQVGHCIDLVDLLLFHLGRQDSDPEEVVFYLVDLLGRRLVRLALVFWPSPI